ncbi:MAG: hypothetical protein QM757_31425 [Paludibaculum sp.]
MFDLQRGRHAHRPHARHDPHDGPRRLQPHLSLHRCAGAHHGLSHHHGRPEKIEKITKINVLHAELFAYFLGELQNAQDGDGTMLDHTIIVYGTGLTDGNAHEHHDLPLLVAGGANGAFKMGRHVRYPKETPLNNLFLSMLDTAGVRSESLGDSTGRLPRLTDLTA